MDSTEHLPFQQEVFKLFPSSLPQTAHELEAEIEKTARQLAESANKAPEWAISRGENYDGDGPQFYKGAVLAILEYALQKPYAIDFLVTVYERAINLFPKTIKPSHALAIRIARKKFCSQLRVVRGEESLSGYAGKSADTNPRINSRLTLKIVKFETQTMKVLADIQVGSRHEAIQFVANALLARNFAVNKNFAYSEYRFIDPMDQAFKQDPDIWSRAHFIGQCIFLRGCAKSLFELREEVADDIKGMEKGLKKCREDEDPMIKHHANLALDNILNGPKDETCKQLFDRENWMF